MILADEATGNLDSSTEKEILDFLDELHGLGKTIVLVTHNENLAERAERVLVLADGKIESIQETGKRAERNK